MSEIPWFKVDDGFAGSPKRAACSPAALGVWVVAGSWSAQQLTDGFIPVHVLPMLGGRPRDAAELVRVGLWETSDGGWRFHDWLDYQPTREQVEAERCAARERQRRAREKAASQRESQRESRRDADVSHGVVTAGVTVPPTRPDPSVVPDGTTVGPRKRGERLPDDWKPDLDLIAEMRAEGIPDELARRELARFRDYWHAKAGRDATKLDWPATWRNWLRRAGDEHPRPSKPSLAVVGETFRTWTPPEGDA